MRITIEHVLFHANTELTKQVWEFWLADDYADIKLILNSYMQLERAHKRRDFKVRYVVDNEGMEKPMVYKRLYKRDSGMTVDEVELPDFVIEQAKKQVMDSLVVIKKA